MVVLQLNEVLDDISENTGVSCDQLVDEVELHQLIDWDKKLINILHVNIRSVNKNLDNLILLLESYNLYSNDIIVMSESFQIESVDQCNIPGYNTYYNNADFNKNDGVVIMVKTGIDVEFSSVKLPNSNATVSRLLFKVGGLTYGITAVYKPPPIPIVDLVSDLHSFFEENVTENIEIFVGDINIDLLDSRSDDVLRYSSTMAHFGFVSYINSVTRPETKTCLDHIFVNRKLKSEYVSCKTNRLDSLITDHYPVMLTVERRGKVSENDGDAGYDNTVRTKVDLVKFKNLLQSQDWSWVTDLQDPNSAFRVFLYTFKELLSQATRSYRVTVQKYKKIKAWITNGIITSIKNRDKMKRKLAKHHSIELENEYRAYRNSLNKIIHKQKSSYYRSEIETNKHDIKHLYNIIKDACYEKTRNNKTGIKDDRGHDFADEVSMANFCNDYFANVGLQMAEMIPCPSQMETLPEPLPASMYLSPVSGNELIRHIFSLRNNSSPGVDGIDAKLIKMTHLEIISPLVHIINLIFQTAIIPDDFKRTIVKPIHKSGSTEDIKNYRPVSMITNFTKIFEKALKERFMSFFKANNIISDNQYGFLNGSSTDGAMYRLVEEVTKNLDDGKKCIGVFIDLAKAFDTVPHGRLLDTLSLYGVRGAVRELVKNYLTGRYQTVKIGSCLGDERAVKIGVPQGTVLGPIFFIAYINSLLKTNVGGLMVSYADDTAIIFSDDSWSEVKKKTERGLIIIKNWLETFKLTLNIQKTCYVAFSLTSANRPHFSGITLGGREINEVQSVRYLGVYIDQFIKWHFHTDFLAGKIRRMIHKFYILRSFLSKKVLVVVYKAFVESLLRYGVLIWGGMYENGLYKLNVVQKHILKLIFRKNKLYPSNLLFSEEVTNIRTIYLNTVCNFFHKNSVFLLRPVNHIYDTRANTGRHYQIPSSRTNINLRFACFIAPKVLNMLPDSIRCLQNIKRFKIECKRYIFNNFHVFSHLFRPL